MGIEPENVFRCGASGERGFCKKHPSLGVIAGRSGREGKGGVQPHGGVRAIVAREEAGGDLGDRGGFLLSARCGHGAAEGFLQLGAGDRAGAEQARVARIA